MAGYPSPPAAGLNIGGGGYFGGVDKSKPVLEKTKAVGYNATTSDQIFAISSDAAATTKESLPQLVEIENDGQVPIVVMVGYQEYSSDTAESDNPEYLHTMLMPGDTFNPPVRAVIRTGESTVIMDGTAVDNTAPSVTANFAYSDSGTTIDDAGVEAADTSITVDNGAFFRVNDLIQFGINTTTATKIEICRVTAIATHVLTLERALYGTTANDKDTQTNATSGVVDNAKIYFPFFNAYYDHDKYTVVQTDSNGKFTCQNFFGAGRAASAVQGLIPGSVALKFYEAGYKELGLSGLTSSTETGLTAGGSYWFKIAIDGGTAESINFTVDSSNTKWGGTNGVLSLINDALEDKYNNTASNTFQQKSSVAIVNGDVRFTSGQRLSTSAIALTAGVDGASASYNIFAQQNGWFPALANVPDPVDAKLPDDVVYDRVTYATSPNSGVFLYDNGYGSLVGNGSGTINYETGAIDMRGCPPNAEFVFSCLHTSAFSGRLNEGVTDRINSLVDVYANTTSQKCLGSVKVRTY